MNFLNKIVLTIAIITLSFVSHASISSAQVSSVLTKNFGGMIISVVPANPLCPITHTLIFDFASKTPMGIATVFGTKVYRNYNLITPNNYVLGAASQTPIPCVLPYIIYPIIEVGTS